MNSQTSTPDRVHRGSSQTEAHAIIERLKRATDLKTDAELAKAIGVSRTTISNWRTRNSIAWERVWPLCFKYAVPLDYLLGRTGPNRYIAPPMDVELLAFVFRLLAQYGFIQLPPAEGFDTAKRAAAEFAELEGQIRQLLNRLVGEDDLSLAEAKQRLIARGLAETPETGPQ